MTSGILGKKLGMTQIFQEDGTVIPVTVLQAGPCQVLQVKAAKASELPEEHRTASASKGKRQGSKPRPRRDDGYYALQLGFDDKPERVASKAEIGHAKASGNAPKRLIREFRCDSMPEHKAGDTVTVEIFSDVKRVDITGTTKGRGFAGTIKRHNFSRQSSSHGNSKSHRRVGGIGRQYSTHHGVPRGKKMPGHYGVEQRTVQNLEVVKVDAERNLLFVRGAVPGHRSAFVVVQQSVKKRKSDA